MATLYGIDVSTHNGTLNWSALKASGAVDFAILRAGYGQNHLDAQFNNNVLGCLTENIPYGIYWFSYALSVQDAENEAVYAVNRLTAAGGSSSNITYGIWYDWEYDSDDNAARQGVQMTPQLRAEFAFAFLNKVTALGYNAGIYTNPDYINNKGFRPVVEAGWPLWLAQWGVAQPSRTCSIWQYGITQIPGITGDFDGDMISDDYPPLPPGPGPGPTPVEDEDKMPVWMYVRRRFYIRG